MPVQGKTLSRVEQVKSPEIDLNQEGRVIAEGRYQEGEEGGNMRRAPRTLERWLS